MSCLPPGAAQQPGRCANPMDAWIVGERYRLDAWLATGGRGQVWRAEDLALGRPVAVNLLSPAQAPDAPAEALDAIMSGYEDARARIISAASSSSTGRQTADGASDTDAVGVAPTVPVDLGSGFPCPGPTLLEQARAASPTTPERPRQGLLRSLRARTTGLMRRSDQTPCGGRP